MMKSAPLLFVAAALLSTSAVARTFRCEEVFGTNATSENSAVDCFTNITHMQNVLLDDNHLPHVIAALLPLFFFLLGFLCCPLVCCARYVCRCCGGFRRTPDTCCCACGSLYTSDPTDLGRVVTAEETDAAYSPGTIICAKSCSVIVLVIGFAFLLLTVVGTTLINDTYVEVFVETKSVLAWVTGKSNSIRLLMSTNSTNPSDPELIPPLSAGFFDNITSQVDDFRSQINDAKDSADPYMDSVSLIALCVGVVPLLFLILTVTAAICDIRTGLLCCNLCCHWLFLIPYGIFGFVFLVIALILGSICGERDAYLADPSAPNLINLALVPQCTEQNPFGTAEDDINQVIREQAQNACDGMLNICNPSDPVYRALTNPEEVYFCPLLGTSPTCTSFITASNLANGMVLKTDPSLYCTDPVPTCNMSMCAKSCNLDIARTGSDTVTTSLGYASNGEIAFVVYVAPLLSCDTVYEQALRPLKVCDDFVFSLQLVGGAFSGYALLFCLGMIVIWRGQKRFFKQPSDEEYTDEDDEFDDIASPSKGGNDPYGDTAAPKKFQEDA